MNSGLQQGFISWEVARKHALDRDFAWKLPAMSTELTEWLDATRRSGTWTDHDLQSQRRNYTTRPATYIDHDLQTLYDYLMFSLSPLEAAIKFSEVTPPEQLLHRNHKIKRIWNLLYSCIEHVEESHEPIIDLLGAIEGFPKPQEKWVVDWTDQSSAFGWRWQEKHDGKLLRHKTLPLRR